MTEEKVGTLEDEALKRKERLQNLKRKHEADDNKNKVGDEPLPKPIFRSYKPQDEKLKEATLPKAEPVKVEEEIKDQLDAGKNKIIIGELDSQTLAPRKPDWDLKRDIAQKLEILEKRTERAIVQLNREKFQKNKNDLSTMVNISSQLSNKNDSDEQ